MTSLAPGNHGNLKKWQSCSRLSSNIGIIFLDFRKRGNDDVCLKEIHREQVNPVFAFLLKQIQFNPIVDDWPIKHDICFNEGSFASINK